MADTNSFSPFPPTQETKPIKRAALYARVSTLIGQNPEMQLAELREYAAHRGWTITNEYVDRGVSGAKESRPALNKLMADAHRRRFDAVVVWKLDRFARHRWAQGKMGKKASA
jgi:DNA invertase Pin-like site-specific DNA recombinase